MKGLRPMNPLGPKTHAFLFTKYPLKFDVEFSNKQQKKSAFQFH